LESPEKFTLTQLKPYVKPFDSDFITRFSKLIHTPRVFIQGISEKHAMVTACTRILAYNPGLRRSAGALAVTNLFFDAP